MATPTLIVSDVSYDLASLYRYTGHDGLGMAPLHRLTERGPAQHGATDLGFRLDPRVFRLFFIIEATDLADVYEERDGILRLFRPLDDALQLRWTFDDGSVRQIDAHYSADLGMGTDGLKGFNQVLAVTMVAPDPTFYDPDADVEIFALGAGGGAFEVPMEVPLSVGASTLDVTQTIYYTGSWRTFPFIRIVGPITSPKVQNLTTDEKIDFSGTTIDAGDYYDIDCRWGFKTVVDSDEANTIADLTSDSDLATFHLEAPMGSAANKPNDIQVTGSAATAATTVYLRYYNRYIGI